MRSEEEMLSLILRKAADSENIRMVELNGSRVHLQIAKDPFQDYDIVYYVEDMLPFLENHSWVDYFGERIMMQMPDGMVMPPAGNKRESFSYLMLFTDGNRIDLTLTPVSLIEESLAKKEPRKILLDKDDRLSRLLMNTENPFRIVEPGQQEFSDCANEFWWVSTYIAKALWRQELPLAKDMMDGPVRDMLMAMLNWHIGVETAFTAIPGKSGKNIEKYVDKELWQKLLLTYPDGSYANMWSGLFAMCEIFEELTIAVAVKLELALPEYGKDVLPYLRHIEKLPRDSATIYP